MRTELSKVNRTGKTDRTARLLKVEHLLYQNPNGLMIEGIARLCDVSKRTTYRDLRSLESELGVPIWEEGSKRGIAEGYLLPPIHFTLPEALNIFLAARLMLNYAHSYDPSMASIFVKLNSIVPPPLRDEIQKTLDWLQKQPRNEKYLIILAALAEAWVSRRQIKIAYRSLPAEKATERIIEPYFIEPAASGHSSYVIAYCHLTKSLRTFKIARIEAVEPTAEPYVISSDFDANELLGSSWGIVVKGEAKTIRLRFAPQIARIMEETVWHPSQMLKRQKDGSLIMTIQVMDTIELFRWILGWGGDVEVLEPPEIREAVMETAEGVREVYMKRKK